jgi:parallel beta-helix repeat protein
MRTPRHRAAYRAARLASCAAALFAATPASAKTLEVSAGGSIQAAVDSAAPGDTIRLEAGIYSGSGGLALVHVRTSGLRIEAPRAALLDAHGYRYGILVGDDTALDTKACPPVTVHGYAQSGVTVRGAALTGLELSGVDNFSLRGGALLENGAHGAATHCSAHGLLSGNFAAGQRDAALLISDSTHIVVEDNAVTESAIGVQVENSSSAVVRHNQLFGNTSGIVVVISPGLPHAATDHVRIEENAVVQNNLPNPNAAGGAARAGAIPSGSGILNAGGDHVSIQRNLILSNDSFGIASIASPFALVDPRVEPFVDDQRVQRNVILLNGQSPDPERAALPGADIVFLPDLIDFSSGAVLRQDPDPGDDCFEQNRFFTEHPAGVSGELGCP